MADEPAAQPTLSRPISTARRTNDGEPSSIRKKVSAGPGRKAHSRNARRAHISSSAADRLGYSSTVERSMSTCSH